jgi:hypothetical protein
MKARLNANHAAPEAMKALARSRPISSRVGLSLA